MSKYVLSISCNHRLAAEGVLACLSYSICSMLMTFTNKVVFSTYNYKYPTSFLLYQNTFTVCLVSAASLFGWIKFNPFSSIKRNLVKDWLPSNVMFILMIISGSYALKYLSVPMVTIFKNITTTLVAVGDYSFFHQKLNAPIVASIFLMITSSIVAGLNDLSFDAFGYVWMAINCCASAAYVLYLRLAMKKTQLTEWGMVYYNNLLSIPFLLVFVLVTSELHVAVTDLREFGSDFLVMCIISGMMSFLISVTSLWAVRATSPTTYSIVGALNKIPLTFLSFVFFDVTITFLGKISIIIGLSAGILYAVAKQQLMQQQRQQDAFSYPASPLSSLLPLTQQQSQGAWSNQQNSLLYHRNYKIHQV